MRRVAMAVLTMGALIGAPGAASAQTKPAETSNPGFVVECYYRIRWGFEDEFVALYRKNHLPFLRRMLEKGSLLEVRIEKPREHMAESERWDLRTTLVYRDAAAAIGLGEIDEKDYLAIVGDPESEAKFKEEERRRFEVLLAHWDLNVGPVDTYTREALPEVSNRTDAKP